MNNPAKAVVDTIENIGEKIVNESIKQTEITAKELLGDIKPLNDKELEQQKNEEEKKKQREMEELKKTIGQGRNVEEEIEKIRQEKKRKEDEEEKAFLENIQRQREAERQQEAMMGMETGSSNPAKQKKSRGSAFSKKKKSQPAMDQMSQTAEFKGKID